MITYAEASSPNSIEADDNEQLFSLGHSHKSPIILVQGSHIGLEIQDKCLRAGRELWQDFLVQPDESVAFGTCVLFYH